MERQSPAKESISHGEESASEPISLFFCGDVMTGRGVDQALPHPSKPELYEPFVRDSREYVRLAENAHGTISRPLEFADIWGDALGELERFSPDVRIVNLETSVTVSDDAWPGKGIHYRMHPRNVDCLKAAKIDCCSLANNHVLDWGIAGLLETLETLHHAGLKTVGAGRSVEEAEAPTIFPASGQSRVLVVACGSPTSGIPPEWAARSDRPGVHVVSEWSESLIDHVCHIIQGARRPGDVVVVSIHWGPNWGYGISQSEQDFAHRLIDDAGVNLIHGHSSHHVKGIEVYQGRLILYGCGDFLTDYEGIGGYDPYRGDLGLMYFARLDRATGRLASLDMTATRMRRFRIERAGLDDARWLNSLLNREGTPLGTRTTFNDEGRLTLHWN